MQPSHKLCPARFTKKEAKTEAAKYMADVVGKTPTVEAGSTVQAFVSGVFFPKAETTLARNTVGVYEQAWKRLQPHLGHVRLRDVQTKHVPQALDAIKAERGDTLSHGKYLHAKVAASAIFGEAIRLGHHPGPNPVTETKVSNYGHTRHRPNEAYSLEEIKQFLTIFPSGQLAVAIGLNAFLALREPELRALMPDDFDGDHVRVWRDTKTGNDERLPVIAPLKRILSDGWKPISLRGAKKTISKRLKGTGLRWKGWYAFRRGMATNLFELGVPVEVAALVLRNTPEVVRAHYLKLEQAGKKVDAMARLEQAFNALEDNAKASTHLGVQSTVQ